MIFFLASCVGQDKVVILAVDYPGNGVRVLWERREKLLAVMAGAYV